MTRSHTRTVFPRFALSTYRFDWFIELSLSFVIGQSGNQFGFALTSPELKRLCYDITPLTLFSYISQAQHAMKKSEAALATITKAMTIDPKNPLCKFHRASILFSMDKHQVKTSCYVSEFSFWALLQFENFL